MITADQVRESSYDKVVIWCEANLQCEILNAHELEQRSTSKLFWEHEVNPEKLEEFLKKQGFKVKITNLSKRYSIFFACGELYEAIIYW